MNTNKLITAFTLLTAIIAITTIANAADNPPSAPQNVLQLLRVDPRGGKIVQPENFDLTKPNAGWQDQPGARLIYEQTYQQFGSYKLELDNPAESKSTSRELWSKHGIKVDRNRTYLVSVFLKTDFPRDPTEFSFSMRFFDADGNRMAPRHLVGAPSKTDGPDGWQRLEWEVNVPDDMTIHEARASIFASWKHLDRPAEFRIADFAFVELPIKALHALPRGEGVTFSGGPGNLPMHVESATKNNGHIIVKTTGAKFDFDIENNTILASQRIEFPRDLAKWQSSLSFAGLRIDKKTDDVCVLTNDQLTVGIQGDSMMAISPQHQLKMTLTNLFGGDFNRYARGFLYSTDDFGGITVNPYIPMGTGKTAQSKLLTKGLSFAEYAERDYDNTGKADRGWQAQWSTSPGELFCTSVFPPRPYPWEKSFESGWKLMKHGTLLSAYNHDIPFVNTWLLWDFIPKMWGHSYSDYYKPYDANDFRATVQKIHEIGDQAIPYMSAYWTPTRDAKTFLDGIRQFKDEYGIDGIYSDGLPSADWILSYKEMRMLRELFPDGTIIVHDSFRQSGHAMSQFAPFLYTYATFNYMAEGAETHLGKDWQLPRYITSMFRKTNNLGATKGNKWFDKEGKEMGDLKPLVDVIYNGRDNFGFPRPKYYKILDQLHDLWKEKGNEPHFYDRYYLPKAQELTEYKIGRTAMPIVERNKNAITLKSLSPNAVIYYTSDGSNPTENSTRYKSTFSIDSNVIIKAIAIAPALEPSAVAVITAE